MGRGLERTNPYDAAVPGRATLTRALAVVVVAGAASAVASGPAGAATSTSRALPVVRCKTTYGADGTPSSYVPQRLTATLDAAQARKLEFFSNGRISVLAPRGWSCSALVAANGSEDLTVTPKPVDANSTKPITGPSVQVGQDYTGHGPGAQTICPYFPSSPAASLAADTGGCPKLPHGEVVHSVTPDLVTFRLPDGTTGAALYPQVGQEGDGVTVTVVDCLVAKSAKGLCAPIIADEIERSPMRFDYQPGS
jgi:hypothetical protein